MKNLQEVKQQFESKKTTPKNHLNSEVTKLRRQIKLQQQEINKLQKLAMEDSLTGLVNRRFFEESLTKAIAQHERHSRGGAVLLIDINSFKAINDTLGHQAGDAILVHISKLLEAHVRESDIVSRIGGDEFCIILNEVSKSEALAKATEIDAVVATYPCSFEGKEIQTSISVGMCSFEDEQEEEVLIQKADEEMYKAKQIKYADNIVKL